jgi:cell cycle checkpoint control protein RAD9A
MVRKYTVLEAYFVDWLPPLGVKKTYKLTYEAVEVRHAVFNKATAKNHWSMGAHVLRSFSEYFGTNTEQLDMYYEASRFTFTSYTEKVMNGNGMFESISFATDS